MHIYVCIYNHTWLTTRSIDRHNRLMKERNMKRRQGKTSKNLFLRSAKNWFENRSCLCSTGDILIFTSPSALGSDFLDPTVTKALIAFVLNFLSRALAGLNQDSTVSPSSSVWSPNRECTTLLDVRELWLFIGGVLVWNTCAFTQPRGNAVDPLS